MRDTLREAILGTVKDLHRSGLVPEAKVKQMERLCLKEYSPAAIVRLRHRYHVSQAKFAQLLNISPATVRNWEAGTHKPRGAALKLLNLLESQEYGEI